MTDTPAYDGDMRLPPFVLHFAPVLLALFCLVLSLSGYSVFRGFEEKEPGTWMSLTLMFVSFLLVFPVMRNRDMVPQKRKIAILFCTIITLALLDERLMWHEAIGRYARRHWDILPRGVLNYTDDVIILAGAIVGAIVLYYCIRIFSDKDEYQWYFWCVVVIAIAHGCLDILAHKHYLWKLFSPEATLHNTYSVREVLGFFEESCKLWTEWFVILFIARYFYGQKGFLLWSIQVFCGGMIAVAGLWGIGNIDEGIPYMIMGTSLKFIRNYQFFLPLAFVWLVWAGVAWRLFRMDTTKRTLAGVFFLCPYYLLLPELSQAVSFSAFSGGISGTVQYILVFAALAGIVLALMFKVDRRILFSFIIMAGVIGFSPGKLSMQPLLLVKTGGILFPFAALYIIKEQRRKWILIGLILFSAVFIQNAVWLVGACGFSLICLIGMVDWWKDAGEYFWKSLIVVQIVSLILIMSLYYPPYYIPNTKFVPKEVVLFQTGHQMVIDKGR